MSSIVQPNRVRTEAQSDVPTVLVVTPMYKQPNTLSADEEISLRHLEHYLGHFDRCLVVPHHFEINLTGFEIKRFDERYFAGVHTYSQLLLSPGFYESFLDYDYILIYQLDALVFSDDLLKWCQVGLDYIGAPWLKSRSEPERGFSRCGNGGLSLRRVRRFLEVLNSKRYEEERVSLFADIFNAPLPDLTDMPLGQRWVKRLSVLRAARCGIRWYARNYTINEDHFWSDRARLFLPDFKISTVGVGLRFAFEFAPRYCFEQNQQTLPFGCHAWAKHDKAFWQSFLMRGKQ